MNASLKNLIKTSLYAAGYYHVRGALMTRSEPRLLVLMYHDILDDRRSRDPEELDVESPNTAQFDAHLRVITGHYRIVSLPDAVERLLSGTLSESSVAITFDDGYRSVYTAAYPVLRRYGAPATVFLLTDWIDSGIPYWWHRVRDMIRQSPVQTAVVHELKAVLGVTQLPLGTGPLDTRARRALARATEECFRDMTDEERNPRIERLEKLLFPCGAYSPAEPGALTWDQAREMAQGGITFEAHTCSHINIRHASRDAVQDELARSKRAIEQNIGREVTGFAYPYGKDVAAYREIEGMLERQGYRWACTAQTGVNSRDTNPYFLLRGGLPSTKSRALIHRDLMLLYSRSSRRE